jgi:hypothetical protein
MNRKNNKAINKTENSNLNYIVSQKVKNYELEDVNENNAILNKLEKELS